MITASGFSLPECDLSAKPDYSGLTTMGRFMADEGIGRMEKLIRSSALVQPQTTGEWAGERSRNRKTTSVAVEAGSVCSLDTNRIARDFGGK